MHTITLLTTRIGEWRNGLGQTRLPGVIGIITLNQG